MKRRSVHVRAFLLCQKLLVTVLLLVLLFSDFARQPLAPLVPFVPEVPTAEAASGDLAIFRRATGQHVIPPATSTPMDVRWDTTVQSNSNITLQSNNSDIDLADGGKYLVMYNVWTEQGTTTSGSDRRSQHTWLSLAGNDLVDGHGGGYLRDSDNTVYLYNQGSAIIDANAGDDLAVNVIRDDTNGAAGVNMRANTNGVNVLKLNDNWDYLRIHRSATTTDIDGNTTFTDLTWDTDDEVATSSFEFTPTSGDITLKGDDDDHFLVSVNVRMSKSINNTRENYEGRLTLDGAEIPGTRVSAVVRGNTLGNGTLTGTLNYIGIIRKDAVGDQTLNFEYRRESSASGGTTVINGDQAAMAIAALPDEGSYVMLNRSATTSGASAATALQFDTQDEVDSYAFSHSTTSNPSRVEIDRAGNYMFFSTAYAVNSSNNRQPFRINWRKDGSDLQYGSHGAYVRGNQSFSGGSSGGVLLDDLTTSNYIEITQHDETGTPADLEFQADRVAIQGVLLDDNFFGVDVLVSATGTTATTTDITNTDFYNGGVFVIQEQTGSRSITDIILTESGTVDAAGGLDNVGVFYDLDTSSPYDCVSETYNGTELQFGNDSEFSGANGTVSFTDSETINTTRAMCVYVVYDVNATSTDGQTVDISINNPSTDVDGSGSPAVGPVTAVDITGSTTLRNAELTLTHYRWLNDDGGEGSATAIEAEDTPAIGFANSTTRRLRLQIDAAGSTSSLPTVFRLDYATKTAACSTLTNWVDIADSGGAWDMSDSPNITDGTNATNIAPASGGVTDPSGASFLSANGGLKDIFSTTSALTATSGDFIEFEYAIEPTATAPQGNTYCFRLSDDGTALRDYDVYAEGTISADIDVSATSSQVSSVDVGSNNNYIGGAFVIERAGTARTISEITITENGTVDGATNINDIRLYYDVDTTTPFDCTGESYAGSEPQFGATSTAFSGANGTSTFSGSEAINSSRSMCVYVVMDVGVDATDGETINIEIADPSNDVVATSSSVGPSTAVSPTGSTTIAGPVLTQTHYHWRNDDGDETDTGATSATGGNEDTALTNVPKQSTRRLRVQVSNEGSVTAQATTFNLEYGTKVTTCSAVASWNQVGVGSAFATSASAFIADGNTTDIDNAANGAMTEPVGSTFVGTGALREDSVVSGSQTLTSTQYTELEFSIEATDFSGFDTDYCFRMTASGTPLLAYDQYAELTTREKQDFFIQRGTAVLNGSSLTINANASYTPPFATSSAFVRISNSHMTGAGDDIGTNGQTPDNVTAYISDQSDITNSFTIERIGTTANTRVDWEIIEYIGLPGADNEMIVRRVGQEQFAATEFTHSGTTTDSVVDDGDVVVFITGQRNRSNSNAQNNDSLFTATWNATTSQPDFERGDADVAADLGYAVVEFTGLNWKIQRIEHSYSVAGSAETEPMTAIGSISRAFVHAQKRVGEGLQAIDEGGHRVWISSLGLVSFELQSGAGTPGDHVSVAWVLENVQTGTGAMVSRQEADFLDQPGASEPLSTFYDIGTTINTANASIWGTSYSAGGGTTYPRLHAAFTIASSTHFEFWQSDTNNDHWFQAETVEWPVAELAFEQNYYRFYVDNDTATPTDPWPVGAANLGENTSISGADEPLGEGERVRIRMTLNVNNASMPEDTTSFKLQFGERETSCSAISAWTDVGAVGSGSIWRGYNGAPIDGAELDGTLISVADVAATYEEANNTAVNPNFADVDDDVEYDWVVEHNGATQITDYCFRMVLSDGTELASYNNYPTVRTTGYTPVIANWRWYDDATSTTPASPLAPENVAPSGVASGNEIKLRVTAAEVESAPSANVKFALQYSEFSDFSDGGTTLVATSSCGVTSTWCYAEGAGIDNATITAAVLSDADSCIAAAGTGCGTHNETATSASTHFQGSLTNMEYEFTIVPAAPRAGAVYYFRLFDVTHDVAVGASSTYPSLVAESAQLVFTTTGLPVGTSTEGIVTDVTTATSTIGFGEVPFSNDYKAAHRLTIDTNATEGYQVFIVADQALTDGYGMTIPSVSGTNASPVGWTVGCGSQVACFGYHAGDDSLLSGNPARFGSDDSYATLSTTTLEEIAYSSIPVRESHDVVYRIEVSESQPAGEYALGVTYIVVPVY